MLSYAFTEEQDDLRQMVREFAQAEIAPLVEEAERSEKFPVQILPMLGELGLLGIVFPEEYGGIGADKITVVPPEGLICIPADCAMTVMEGFEGYVVILDWVGS